MSIELLVQDNELGTIYDISELVSSIEWQTSFEDQPGKLTFEYVNDHNVVINEGSVISLKSDNTKVFYGYVFTKALPATDQFEITAYDQMRYLKNKDTYVLADATASQIFTKLCKDMNLQHKVVNASSYKVAPRVCDNETLFEIIQGGIDHTLINTGNWFMIYDNFGTLEFANVNNLKTDLVVGDESLLMDYEYESSIDSDTYNQVKLVKENKETQKRELFIVKDSSNIKKWGLLQYFETVDENANKSQIAERAEAILRLKNRATKTLKLECLGDLRVRAGSGIVLSIEDLTKEKLANEQYYIVTECTHKFENDMHTMKLTVKVSV